MMTCRSREGKSRPTTLSIRSPQSLVAGAGAPTGEPEIHPETHVASNAYVSAADKDNMGPKLVADKSGNVWVEKDDK